MLEDFWDEMRETNYYEKFQIRLNLFELCSAGAN